MLTLYHAPQSRSSGVIRLLDELGALDRVEVRTVGIRRLRTGTGAADPANPHPEGKVPLLVHDGVMIRERNAIMLHLTELFPEAGLGATPGTAERGAFLSWLAYYGNVMEPVFIAAFTGVTSPGFHATFRGMGEVTAMLRSGLAQGKWLLGGRYSAADLLLASPYGWAPEMMPEDPVVRDWIGRCLASPLSEKARAFDRMEGR
jgi:glutathione S-transferase